MSTLEMPVCEECATVQYPVREACVRCLSSRLQRKAVDAQGVVLARTRLHRSMDERFAPRLPLDIASVMLDCGPVVIAILEQPLEAGGRVRLRSAPGPDGRTVMYAGRMD